MVEVTGLSPFQRKMMEMLKTGDSVKEKKAVRLARKRTGSHKRAQLVRDKIATIIQDQASAARTAAADKKAEKKEAKWVQTSTLFRNISASRRDQNRAFLVS